MKKYLGILFAIMVFLVSTSNAFAMETTDDTNSSITGGKNDVLSIDEYNLLFSGDILKVNATEDIIHLNDAPATMLNTLSDWQTQTKNVVLKNDGSTIGSVTLRYKTWIQGGRPQFVYDTCTISQPVFNTYWTLVDSNVSYSGDVISVNYNFVFGPITDTAWVYFYP